jgi:hypothetical protein
LGIPWGAVAQNALEVRHLGEPQIIILDGSVAYHFLGEYRVFPGGSEISINIVRQALKQFLASGGEVPTCVKWRSLDDWVEWPE